jgi:murein DD-endopeptidase MepM/ murein hydrolase activator NlpD
MVNKRVISIASALIVSSLTLSTVHADQLTDKKKQLNEVKSNINNLKSKINDVKEEKTDVLVEINKINRQVDDVQASIHSLETRIETTQTQIKIADSELEDAIEDFESQKDLYGQRLKAMYINGPQGYIEVLLASESFSDLIARTDMVKKIIDYDKLILEEIKEKQEAIEEKKDMLQSKKVQLVSLESAAQEKKIELDDANERKKAYYNKLEKNQDSYEKALDDELAESQALEKQIQAILQKSGSQGSYSGSKTGIVKVSDIGRVPKITSPFGMRYHPILKKDKMHTGIDIGIATGTPIYAMSEGKVIISTYSSSYGNMVVIDHGGGISSLYAHNSKLLVSEGQTVKKGQMIAKAGSTGRSTGPHLHFEVRKNGTPINPVPYYIVGQ